MTHEYPRNPTFDSVSFSRVSALGDFGLTQRQREFLVTVMVHSGCFLERQYCACSGTARGQNSREFVARLVTRGFARAIEPAAVQRGRLYHVHHKPLYEAIGQPDNRNRRLPSLGRMVERVMILDAVLSDRRCWWLGPEADKRSFFDVVHFVIVFNLTRFARDKYDHFALRSFLKSLGISLRSATEPIDDTSTGKLMEGVLAAFAQFDNDCRSDGTRAGMKAALELGRWTFLAPIGYLNAPRAMGKSLMPDMERAPLVRRAFEEYQTGRYTKEQLLKQTRAWGLTNRRGRSLSSHAIGMLLRNRLYASIVDVFSGRRPLEA